MWRYRRVLLETAVHRVRVLKCILLKAILRSIDIWPYLSESRSKSSHRHVKRRGTSLLRVTAYIFDDTAGRVVIFVASETRTNPPLPRRVHTAARTDTNTPCCDASAFVFLDRFVREKFVCFAPYIMRKTRRRRPRRR